MRMVVTVFNHHKNMTEINLPPMGVAGEVRAFSRQTLCKFAAKCQQLARRFPI